MTMVHLEELEAALQRQFEADMAYIQRVRQLTAELAGGARTPMPTEAVRERIWKGLAGNPAPAPELKAEAAAEKKPEPTYALKANGTPDVSGLARAWVDARKAPFTVKEIVAGVEGMGGGTATRQRLPHFLAYLDQQGQLEKKKEGRICIYTKTAEFTAVRRSGQRLGKASEKEAAYRELRAGMGIKTPGAEAEGE